MEFVRPIVLAIAIAGIAAGCAKSGDEKQASNASSTALPEPPAPPAPAAGSSDELNAALDALGATSTSDNAGSDERRVRLSSAEFAPGQTGFAPSDSERFGKIVSLLQAHPLIKVRIEGFTDARGSETVNMRLSGERAEAVKQALVDHGIDSSRLTAQGLGEANPIADNATAEGRNTNRRVELVFSDSEGRFASAGMTSSAGG